MSTMFAFASRILARHVAEINVLALCMRQNINPAVQCCSHIHTTAAHRSLDDFFEKPDNLGKETIKVGRPWTQSELRIKSNEDLHKLWYVLLKERNMLMTMEEEHKRQVDLFPNPERMEKVEESMLNIMAVVQERDDAVSVLETGETASPKYEWKRNFLGLWYEKELVEHSVPPEMNKVYSLVHPPHHPLLDPYLRLYREKKLKIVKEEKVEAEKKHKRMLKKFPRMRDTDDDHDYSEIKDKIEEERYNQKFKHLN